MQELSTATAWAIFSPAMRAPPGFATVRKLPRSPLADKEPLPVRVRFGARGAGAEFS